MRCSFALIWDKKYSDKQTGNVYNRIALEMPVEKFAETVVDVVNKKLPACSKLSMLKQLFSLSAPLKQEDVVKDVVFATVQAFKDESNWINSEHGEVS